MGGMQTFLWGEKYPEMMDALLPIASQPIAITGRNYVWRRMMTEAIRHDPDWNGGNYAKQPTNWMFTLGVYGIMFPSVVRTQNVAPTPEKSEEAFKRLLAFGASLDANDFLYQYESSWDYDPAPAIAAIKAKLIAVNFADDLINPVELGVMEPAAAKTRNGSVVTVPASVKGAGHYTYFYAETWKPYLEELLK